MDFAAAIARICCFTSSISEHRSSPVDCSRPEGLRKPLLLRTVTAAAGTATLTLFFREAFSLARISRTRTGRSPCMRCRATVTYQPYE